MTEDSVPVTKSGWGTGATDGPSNVGIAQKTVAASYWDNKTTELIIPEMEAETMEDVPQVLIAAPPTMELKMTNLVELNREFAMNVPSVTKDGIDISLLTRNIRPIVDLIETDMQWDYVSLQAEIGQNYREKYGSLEISEIEGTRANNI